MKCRRRIQFLLVVVVVVDADIIAVFIFHYDRGVAIHM
jgi:hypothetical protein